MKISRRTEVHIEGDDSMIDAGTAAAIIGIHPRTLYIRASRGDINVYRDGRKVSFKYADVVKYRDGRLIPARAS